MVVRANNVVHHRAAASDASFENDRIGGSACIASLSGSFLHNWRTHHGCTLWTRDRQITFPIPIVLGANSLRATTDSAEIHLAFNAGETRAAKYSRGNPPDGAPIPIPFYSAHHTRSAIEAGETSTEEPAYQRKHRSSCLQSNDWVLCLVTYRQLAKLWRIEPDNVQHNRAGNRRGRANAKPPGKPGSDSSVCYAVTHRRSPRFYHSDQ